MKIKELEQQYGDKYWGKCAIEMAKRNISRGIKEDLAVQYAMEDLLDQHEKMMDHMGMKSEDDGMEEDNGGMED